MDRNDSTGMHLFRRMAALGLLATVALPAAHAQGEFLYVESNNVAEGQNSVLAYECLPDGSLRPHPDSPFLTAGTGIDNDTNGKLGPNDNDTPLVITADKQWLFAVNGHSDTIAAFSVCADGSLRHAPGSPFDSMGVGPVSLAVRAGVLLVANRNEDPQRLAELDGEALANYAAFRVQDDGGLEFVARYELADGQKPTQVLFARAHSDLAFGNDFQVDVDFDGDGAVSKLFGSMPRVRGRIHAFRVDGSGNLESTDAAELPETADPAPDVPSIPLGIYDHPTKNLLYAGFVTRNQLGVFRYSDEGELSFVTAVPNSGQDICWIRTNRAGTRLYAVNNLPRAEMDDGASTVTVFDISGARAERPVEIQRVELPMPLGTFANNRNAAQPESTAFQLTLNEAENHLYVVCQRIDQTAGSAGQKGNYVHYLKVDDEGRISVHGSRDLILDGASRRARPQGLVAVTLD